ncbi:ribonuclease D [Rubrivirga sp.]|uniref:ribonuclease D n=1 Tax=Rubrivirga sp. TaxID=1885344 RepID=UPI003C762B19
MHTATALEDVCARARDLEAVALDTEFVWERTYYPALGLVQMGLGGGDIVLIDTVALEGELGPLGNLLEDESVVKILHDATQDLQILARATDAHPRRAYDTQRAGGFVGLTATTSLQDLVEWGVGLRLDKGETRSNWLRRPLSESQQEYAAADVRYLHELRTKQLAKAEELGRTGWVEDEMTRYDDPDLYLESDPDEAVNRVKVRGIGRMSGRQRAVLRTVSAWREVEARKLDRTRRMVLPDEMLAKIADYGPGSFDDLSSLKMTDRQISRYGDGVLEAVQLGIEAEPEDRPRRGRPGPEEFRQQARLQIAQGFLVGRCERSGVDPILVATKSQLGDLVEAGPDAVQAEMSGWRYEFAGRDLEAVLRGDVGVRLDPEDGWPDVAT